MKRILLITFLIVGLTAAYSFAQMGQGHMMGQGMMGYGGYGMGPGMMGQGHMSGCGMMGRGMMGYGGYGTREYNPEAYQKYQEQYQKYLDDTAGLRKKLHNMKFEYFEAVRNPDTKRDAVLKLEKEIRDLQWDIYEKSPR